MAFAPRQNGPQVAASRPLRRKFPSVLLAVTKDDERRHALLTLTKERFVVTDCAIGHDVVPTWGHPRKFDAVMVQFNEVLDPTCPLVVQDIRRRELQDARQEAAEVQILQMHRLGEGEPIIMAAHRAQRFAERQRDKQKLIEAQRASAVGASPPGSSGPSLRTLIIGFCDQHETDKKSAMDHSGQYDYVLSGNPSDAPNVEFVVQLLRADYVIPVPRSIPTFDDVVMNLTRLRAEMRGGGKRAVEDAAPPPALSEQWQLVLNAGCTSHPKATANTAILSLERQLREAKERLAEVSTSRDSIENDLAAAHRANQQLRSDLAEIQETLASSQDQCMSLQQRFESLAGELEDVKSEADIQLRHASGTSASPQASFSRQTSTMASPAINQDVQHLVKQNNRLRQSAYEYETALHEKTLECSALKRRLKKLISGDNAGTTVRGEHAARRHPSLCRMQLPDAMELFKMEDTTIAPTLNTASVKLGDELDSDDEATQSSASSESEASREPLLIPKRSVRFSKGASMIRSKSSGTLRPRRDDNTMDPDAMAGRESMESMLMAFFDHESRQNALFSGLAEWMQKPGNQTEMSAATLSHPATTLHQEISGGAVLSETWAVVEREFQRSCDARRQLCQDLDASSVLFPNVFANARKPRAQELFTGTSSSTAEDILPVVRGIADEVLHYTLQFSSLQRSVLHDLLASQLQLYDQISLRMRSLVGLEHLATSRSLLNAIVIQNCSHIKKALVKHSAAEISSIPLARQTVLNSVAQVGAVVVPLRNQLEAYTSQLAGRSVDVAAQTEQASSQSAHRPHPPRKG